MDGDIIRISLLIMGTINLWIHGRIFWLERKPRRLAYLILVIGAWLFYIAINLHHYGPNNFDISGLNQMSLGVHMLLQLVLLFLRL